MTFDIKCKHCKRFLATTDKSVELSLKCSNSSCKKLDTYKIVMLTDHNAKRDIITLEQS